MPNIAELQASIKINTEQAQQKLLSINKRVEELNKKFVENEKLTKAETKELKNLTTQYNSLNSSLNKVVKSNENYNKSGKDINKLLINNASLTSKLNKSNNDGIGIWSKLSSRITVAGLAVNVISGSFLEVISK